MIGHHWLLESTGQLQYCVKPRTCYMHVISCKQTGSNNGLSDCVRLGSDVPTVAKHSKYIWKCEFCQLKYYK